MIITTGQGNSFDRRSNRSLTPSNGSSDFDLENYTMSGRNLELGQSTRVSTGTGTRIPTVSSKSAFVSIETMACVGLWAATVAADIGISAFLNHAERFRGMSEDAKTMTAECIPIYGAIACVWLYSFFKSRNRASSNLETGNIPEKKG